MTWVGSADTEKYDQVLDSVLVGPVVPGQYRFVFQVGSRSGWYHGDLSSWQHYVHSHRSTWSAEQLLLLQADGPDGTKLPQQDIVGVTVLLLTCLYQDVVSPRWHLRTA